MFALRRKKSGVKVAMQRTQGTPENLQALKEFFDLIVWGTKYARDVYNMTQSLSDSEYDSQKATDCSPFITPWTTKTWRHNTETR